MIVQHIFNHQVYVITNRVVAANPLFQKSSYRKRFLMKTKEYLRPLCKILSYHIAENEFQFVVRMKSRKDFVKHYKQLRKKNGRSFTKLPHSSYIFSNAMAKLQSGLVAHFNWKEKRTGALFASRFKKILVKSSKELSEWLDRLKKMKKIHVYARRWRHKVKGFRKKKGRRLMKWVSNSFLDSMEKCGQLSEKDKICGDFNIELQAQFNKTPKIKISKKDLRIYLEIRHQIVILN